jgi:hypothetical protein
MPIYEKNNTRILHVHIPKTGGTSITELFRKCGWGIDRWSEDGHGQQHATRQYWKDWGEFDYIFTIVRHPIFRALSDARGRVQNPDEVDHWIQNWCKEGYSKHGDHNRPQVDFFEQGDGEIFYYNTDSHRQKLYSIASFTGSEFEGCCPDGYENIEFPHIKGEGHVNHSPKLLSLNTLEIIQSTFKKDMEEFGFHWLGLKDL